MRPTTTRTGVTQSESARKQHRLAPADSRLPQFTQFTARSNHRADGPSDRWASIRGPPSSPHFAYLRLSFRALAFNTAPFSVTLHQHCGQITSLYQRISKQFSLLYIGATAVRHPAIQRSTAHTYTAPFPRTYLSEWRH
jgi:hypothetical protein